MDNLTEIKIRKAVLKAKIEHQRHDLKQIFVEIREEMEPTNLLKKAVTGALGFSNNKADGSPMNMLSRVPFVAGMLIKDPKILFAVKVLAPFALKLLPKRSPAEEDTIATRLESTPKIPLKIKMYGIMLRGISSLRWRLRKD